MDLLRARGREGRGGAKRERPRSAPRTAHVTAPRWRQRLGLESSLISAVSHVSPSMSDVSQEITIVYEV
jgi:hypothetical protein